MRCFSIQKSTSRGNSHEVLFIVVDNLVYGVCSLLRERDLACPKEVTRLHADLFCKVNGQ